MVVIVVVCEPRVDRLRGLRREVEAIEQPAAVVDQGLPVGGPVGGLQGRRRTVMDRTPARLHGHRLQVAAEVVLIGDERVGRGGDEPYVVKPGLRLPVRRYEKPDVHLRSEIEPRHRVPRERIAEPGCRQDEGGALPLQFEHVGVVHRHPDGFRRIVRSVPDAKDRPSVAVDGPRHDRGRVGEARPHHPACPGRRLGSVLKPGPEHEVALYPPPGEVRAAAGRPPRGRPTPSARSSCGGGGRCRWTG